MKNSSGTEIASVVLGIIGVIFAFCISPIGLILATLSIIFGIIGLSKCKSAMAIAGLAIGITSLIISGVMILMFILLWTDQPKRASENVGFNYTIIDTIKSDTYNFICYSDYNLKVSGKYSCIAELFQVKR